MTPSTHRSEWDIDVGEAHTRAVFEPAPRAANGDVFICAHGAGGHMNDRGMLAVAERLRGRGLDVVRFNFLYREKGSSRPDAMPSLKQCIDAVAARAREEIKPARLIIGGRSGWTCSFDAGRGKLPLRWAAAARLSIASCG